MKKLLSFILTTVFVLSLSALPVRAAETEYERVLKDVNKTNVEISKLIYETVEEAEKEVAKYIAELEILEKGEDVVKLEGEISNLEEKISTLDSSKEDYQDKYEKILKELDKKKDQILKLTKKQEDAASELKNQLEEMKAELHNSENGSKKNIKIKGIINKFEAQIDKPNREIEELTDKINEKIDKIIERLINDTNKKAADMKNRAADKGFKVICELVEVEIDGKVILIDPLRIADL